MSIDIKNLTSQYMRGSVDSKTQVGSEKDASPVSNENGKSSTADTISLSGTARHIGEISATLRSAPVVDTQRVEQIKQALRDGTYQVSAERIAGKFMALDAALNPAR